MTTTDAGALVSTVTEGNVIAGSREGITVATPEMLRPYPRAIVSVPAWKENQLKIYLPHGKLPRSIQPTAQYPAGGSEHYERRGARAAESGSLENCCRGNSTVGSNPTLSAKPSSLDPESSLWLLATG